MRFERSLSVIGLARICAAALCLAALAMALPVSSAYAADTLEERKLPMKFTWYDPGATVCERDCFGWISAVGTINNDTPAQFEEFARGRDLSGVKVVMDSSGGSVLDAIAMGRRWRELKLHTAVGIVIERAPIGGGVERGILPEAYCESMCVFLLLSGQTRFVPTGAHVRVHQIWMGDRADDAKAATYSAQDLMIVERDIGRLAKYTFDMGGSGDLLSLALSVPPWEPLHELTAAELRLTNLVTSDAMASAETDAPAVSGDVTSSTGKKPIQDRVASGASPKAKVKTAEAEAPTGGAAATAPDRP